MQILPSRQQYTTDAARLRQQEMARFMGGQAKPTETVPRPPAPAPAQAAAPPVKTGIAINSTVQNAAQQGQVRPPAAAPAQPQTPSAGNSAFDQSGYDARMQALQGSLGVQAQEAFRDVSATGAQHGDVNALSSSFGADRLARAIAVQQANAATQMMGITEQQQGRQQAGEQFGQGMDWQRYQFGNLSAGQQQQGQMQEQNLAEQRRQFDENVRQFGQDYALRQQALAQQGQLGQAQISASQQEHATPSGSTLATIAAGAGSAPTASTTAGLGMTPTQPQTPQPGSPGYGNAGPQQGGMQYGPMAGTYVDEYGRVHATPY